MEAEMTALQESAGLFEVNVPDYKQLKTCRKEVILLKSLWDVVALVKSSFGDWNTTLWCDINVEQMEMDCKKFVKVSSVGNDCPRGIISKGMEVGAIDDAQFIPATSSYRLFEKNAEWQVMTPIYFR